VWAGFGASTFLPSVNPKTGKAYTYKQDNFEATHYNLSTDQLGTQLDPPAHWNPNYPAIDELPATYTIRPLVVIPIQNCHHQDVAQAVRTGAFDIRDNILRCAYPEW